MSDTSPSLPSPGPSVWDTGILSLFHVKDVAPFDRLPDFGLNESFMVFGGFGLAYNIFSRYELHFVVTEEATKHRPPVI